jgi:hypothetical protein
MTAVIFLSLTSKLWDKSLDLLPFLDYFAASPLAKLKTSPSNLSNAESDDTGDLVTRVLPIGWLRFLSRFRDFAFHDLANLGAKVSTFQLRNPEMNSASDPMV